ncbi:Alpha/Beta hydrolase protein [Mycena leptocephala]|nr:Alpha/Beta hydrolase protein [Mycena leptocephala]
MPSHTLNNGVEFFYTDSGPVDGDYTTCLFIHGHTFHSATFQRMNPFAKPNSLRIICVNRREYPGSSPYSTKDLAIFAGGNEAERANLLEQQGRDLALFLDGIIDTLSIPKAGGIALIGWSMGTLFLLSLISCETLPADTKARLSSLVHTVVLLQPPSLALGLPDPAGRLMPHTDPDIPPEVRGPAFVKWVSSYFIHAATIEALEPGVLVSIADLAPADKYDNIIGLPPFQGPVFAQTHKALFDPALRGAWSGAKFWNLYGSAEPWNIIYAAWFLEDKSRAANTPELAINSKVIEGANHFLVWENPEDAIRELEKCFPV